MSGNLCAIAGWCLLLTGNRGPALAVFVLGACLLIFELKPR